VIGHVTFSITFVVIIVRGRLISIGKDFEEAAMDLGASSVNALRMVLLPLLVPAIVASAIVVFAISMDDFVISAYLSSSAGTETVPVKIYSNARGTPTPALNALASVTLAATVLLGVVMFVLWSLFRRRQGDAGSGLEELARLDV
jgi:spermidine/putrescine transport system permease protein